MIPEGCGCLVAVHFKHGAVSDNQVLMLSRMVSHYGGVESLGELDPDKVAPIHMATLRIAITDGNVHIADLLLESTERLGQDVMPSLEAGPRNFGEVIVQITAGK